MDPDAARRFQREQTTTAAVRIRGTNNTTTRTQQPRRATLVPRKSPPTTFSATLEPISVTDSKIGRIHPVTMNKDAHHTSIHLHRARDADLLEQFCRDRLPSDDIYVPAAHQPVNPEDEDDVVPDQHAAFGIQKATQAKREPAWRDFGLGELMGRGPGVGMGMGTRVVGAGSAGAVGKKTTLPR